MATAGTFNFSTQTNRIKEFLCSTPLDDQAALSKLQGLLAGQVGSDLEKLSCVDLAVRDNLLKIIQDHQHIEDCIPLLNFTLQATSKEICSIATIFNMLLDLADCSTICQCEDLFTYVESQMHCWKTEPFFTKGKNHLLRMCNDILKKLSKSQDTVFCGRIQLFLARLFPLTEKSGLNLLSEFNLDNLTVFSTDTPVDHVELPPEKQAAQMDTDELGLSLANEAPVDYAFYTKFWSLQDYFRDPTQCYNKVSWKKFSMFSDSVLLTFQSLKLDDAKMQRHRQTLSKVRNVKDQQKFFAKYLTSEKLFNLQLSDSNFRRYVLVQFLILYHYLTSQVKFRSSAMQLTEEQQKWIAKSTQTVVDLIKETPPDGAAFATTIQKVLELESIWNTWKNDQCPNFVKKTNPKEHKTRVIVRKRSMIDDLNITNPKTINLGNNELNKLWNLNPDNEAILRSEKRQFVPSMEQYFEDAIMAADPANQIEDVYKDVNKPGWQWRALRLLSKKSRHLFEQTQTPARKIPDYLEDIMRKLAKELTPSLDPTQTNDEEVSIQTGQNQEEEEIEDEPEDVAPSNSEEKATDKIVAEENNSSVVDDEVMDITQQAGESTSFVTNDQLALLAEKILDNWELLALKHLNIEADDIEYIKNDKETPLLQAKHSLTLWKEMKGKEATVGKLSAVLKSAGMGDLVTLILSTTA